MNNKKIRAYKRILRLKLRDQLKKDGIVTSKKLQACLVSYNK